MRTDTASGILQGIDPALGQQLLDEAVGAHVGAQRGRRGGLQSLGAVQLAQAQQPGDLARRLVGMIGVGEDPVGQEDEGATEAGSLGPVRWTPVLRQVAMRESCSYKQPRNRSSQ